MKTIKLMSSETDVLDRYLSYTGRKKLSKRGLTEGWYG